MLLCPQVNRGFCTITDSSGNTTGYIGGKYLSSGPGFALERFYENTAEWKGVYAMTPEQVVASDYCADETTPRDPNTCGMHAPSFAVKYSYTLSGKVAVDNSYDSSGADMRTFVTRAQPNGVIEVIKMGDFLSGVPYLRENKK
jgi:hypothetical protein